MNAVPLTVSVIMPVYNGASFLAEALGSVQRQQVQPLEVIIVDDGSTDETAAIAAEFVKDGPCRYFYQPNRGPSAARNKGLSLARGNVIAFLDVDDLWPEDKLARQLACLQDKPQVQVVMGRTQCLRLNETAAAPRHFEPFSTPFLTVCLGSALYRQSVFERVGLFDETLRFSEDVDWFMRAREQNTPMQVLQETTLFYRLHSDNMTRATDLRDFSFVHVLKRSLDRRRARGILNG